MRRAAMTLERFLKLWTEDGTRLVEHDRQVRNGFLWILYGVYFPESTVDYGRHVALLLKIDGQTKEILGHDMHNITGETVHREVGWFLDHVAKYSDSVKEVVCVSKQGHRKNRGRGSVAKATAGHRVP
jgi:hypothetical protein